MKTYELTYIITSEITPEEANAKSKEIEGVVSSKGGVITEQTSLTAKTLSYPIKKQGSGFLGVLKFQLSPEKIPELKDVIAKDKKIVRHLIVVKKPTSLKTSSKRTLKTKPETTSGTIKKGAERSKEEKKERVELKNIEETLEEILDNNHNI